MNRFEELIISVQAKPSAIIHLGGGSCKEYAFYKSLAPKQVIFVEPDPELAKKAKNKFSNSTDVMVIARAISSKNGQQSLKITNNQRFSSLLSPAQLLDFYPNVVVVDEIEIGAITLKQLCENENIVDETGNFLVVELQGLEKDIFPFLEKSTLHKFKWIIIRSSEQVLYEPESYKPQKNLIQTMGDMGYTTLTFKEDAPPFINILCIRNDAELERLKVQEQVIVLADERNKQFQQIKALTKAGQTKTLESEQTRTKINDLTAEREQLLQRITTLQDTADTGTAELAQTQTKVILLSEKINGQSQEIVELTSSVNEKAKEVTEIQQSMRINNKIMLKSNTDLTDLQLQYRAAIQHQEQQHLLLCELKEKLGQASAFYQQLNLKNLVLDNERLEQSNSNPSDLPGRKSSRDQSTK